MNIYLNNLFTNKTCEVYIIYTIACEYLFTLWLACEYYIYYNVKKNKREDVRRTAHCCHPPHFLILSCKKEHNRSTLVLKRGGAM